MNSGHLPMTSRVGWANMDRMAIDERHPGCFRDAGGELWVTTGDRDEAIAAHRSYDEAMRERIAAIRRRERRFTLVGWAGALLGAGAAVWAAVALLHAEWPVAWMFALVGLLLGALLMLAITNPLLRRRGTTEDSIITRQLPSRPGVRIPAVVIEHAPRQATAAQLAAWSQTVEHERLLRSRVVQARHDATLRPGEREIAPGDRSTWFYDASDFPRFEAEYAGARTAYETVAAELGFIPEAAPGDTGPRDAGPDDD